LKALHSQKLQTKPTTTKMEISIKIEIKTLNKIDFISFKLRDTLVDISNL
jgi:hypothetical protein